MAVTPHSDPIPVRLFSKMRAASLHQGNVRARIGRLRRRTPGTGHDIIVVGGSAGALEALRRIIAGLPRHFQAAIFVVIHSGSGSRQLMAAILERSGPLRASSPDDGDPIVAGRIYVARPDHHLLLERTTIRITKGPKENGFRPAVDPLFRSAARSHGARVIGVILSGGQNDGTLGLAAIKRAGGLTIAQRPDDAIVPSMPESAIQFARADCVLAAAQIPALLLRATGWERKGRMTLRRKGSAVPGGSSHAAVDPVEAGTDLTPRENDSPARVTGRARAETRR